jgi:sec-independent protein translocase protein TatA
MPNIGPLELGVILVIVLIVFGPKRLPGLGRQLGTGMREFKESITGKDKDDEAKRDAFGEREELGAAPVVTPAVVAAPTPEPEVVTGEPRPQDQPASRAD